MKLLKLLFTSPLVLILISLCAHVSLFYYPMSITLFIFLLFNDIILIPFTMHYYGFKAGTLRGSQDSLNKMLSVMDKTIEKELKTLLYLDDYRYPSDSFKHTERTLYKDKHWNIVRSYDEFVSYIEKNGMPDAISFDHDLAPSHYTPEHLWNDYDKSKAWQEAQVHTEKTGEDCAKWLVQYFNEMETKKVPLLMCHSQNPVGKDKINRVLINITTK